jgi:hypothetical protein
MEKNSELHRILYADGDAAHHDARTDWIERTMKGQVKVTTVETTEDALAELRADINDQIIALVVSQSLGNEEVRLILSYLEHIGRKNMETFPIVIRSETVSKQFIRWLQQANTNPGTPLVGKNAPRIIAEAIRDRLVGKKLLPPLPPQTTDTFDPSKTQETPGPGFEQPLREDYTPPSSSTAIDNPEN